VSVQACKSCAHTTGHNQWGKCTTSGCTCRDYTPDLTAVPPPPPKPKKRDLEATVTALRNQATNAPVLIPDSIATEVDRQYNAYLAKQSGLSWDEIAKADGGWGSGRAAAAAVQAYLDEGRAVWADFRRVEGIALEADRLDRQTASVWEKAMTGDIPANGMLLAITRTRAQLFGWLEREAGDAGEEPMPTTVVVASGSYIHDLKALVEGPQPVYDEVIWDDEDPESECYLDDGGTVAGTQAS
jgi:hypothetical protein